MPKLSIEEAFLLLGLPIDAGANAIKKAYHKKSKLYHPDKTSGNENLQAKINDAYDIALAYTKIRTSLVRVDSGSLQHLDRSLDAQRALLAANQSANLIKNKRTRPLQSLKFILLIATGFSAVVAMFGQNILPLVASENSQSYQLYKITFALLAFNLGIVVVWLQWRVSVIQNKIDSYLLELSDPKICAQELSKILSYQDLKSVTENQILNLNNEKGRLTSEPSLPFRILYNTPQKLDSCLRCKMSIS